MPSSCWAEVNFVVVLFDHNAHRGHGREHFAAHVLGRILRRKREVAALGGDAVAEVAAFIIGIRIDREFEQSSLKPVL